jgi:hypothetical protein
MSTPFVDGAFQAAAGSSRRPWEAAMSTLRAWVGNTAAVAFGCLDRCSRAEAGL